MGRPTLEGSAGIFRYDDLAGNSLRLFFEGLKHVKTCQNMLKQA